MSPRVDTIIYAAVVNGPKISAALIGITLLGASVSAWLKWADNKATRFANITHVPLDGE